ncbi:pyridoxal-phosphate dependent enzyme [Sphingobacterium sp. DK4209]|uniref:Pyridoxal-phosphate dependent enzyme n=1 Tax=Sphingobacterium zhuxiongii TaxID=2662364 RepID=A0A5Q0Q9Z2_9SPHI|nr:MULTISPECIES: pyridoxal-phosphate dependent enzyme [unclassified Sphingobacterium]MVZ65271.1 pyridoxal-phosphate dependent enzyme [Sphingobacterium sp. DK4209]QGA26363.1 pyridoxal-phosphate dependent enzyme [Sphingobacterium sp. dk4302]
MSLEFPIYSPVQHIAHPLLTEKNIELAIKRDDMIHPFISGNKWRKLKLHISHMKQLKINKLVTFGGAWSNHLLASAAAGAQFQLKTYAFVRGEDVSNPVLSLCKLFGMHLIFVDRTAYKDKYALFESHFNRDSALFVDEGGRSKEGIIGCETIVEELTESYSDIFLAAGTGTTCAGILSAITKRKENSIVHAIPVLKGGDFIQKDIQDWGIDTVQLRLHTDYHFGGYAKTKPELLEFIHSLIQTTGIMIEPTYTGKMMYALFDQVKQGNIKPNSKILAIHTGGLTGFLGMYEKFDNLASVKELVKTMY